MTGRAPEQVVIVGASAAGTAVALHLRTLGFPGSVLLVGDEPHLPYDRPPLSKQLLSGTWAEDRILLASQVELADQGIEAILGTRAVDVDCASRTVTLEHGRTLSYDALVVATGVSARRLEGTAGLQGVHYLRTLDDARTLAPRLAPGRRIVVVGAGFIGLEVAATACALGCQVDVIEVLDVPLSAKLGPWVGSRVQRLHEDHGVRFHTGTNVDELVNDGVHVTGVAIEGGTVIAADDVVVGVGTTPNTQWLEASGLPVSSDGVMCDVSCRVTAEVYAAGDVAAVLDPATGRPMRTEHRLNATEQGHAVARAIMKLGEPRAGLPFFWTDQYDVKIQMFGTPPPDAEFVVEIEETDPYRMVGSYRRSDRTEAVVGWNAAKLLMPFRRELLSAVEAGASRAV